MNVVPAHSRQATLRELRDFTEQCRSRLTAVLSDWGWEPGGDGNEQETVVCPYDSNHRMPSSCLEKHISVCRLRQLGYSKEEAEAYNPQFYYEKAKVPSVVLDKNKQFQIIKEAQDMAPSTSEDSSWDKNSYSSSPVEVPVTHKRAICDLKPADRLAIYDYVLQKTKEEKSVTSINEADLFQDLTAKIKHEDDQKCPKSHLEIIAEMRDYKRRRQSYRAKNVHITKKSYTEIIRDVINVHMEEFSSNWRDEVHDEASSSVSSSSVKRREQQRSPSVESRQSGGSQRDRHRSGRRRKRSRSPQRQRSQDRDRSSRHRERNEDRRHSHKKKKKEDD